MFVHKGSYQGEYLVVENNVNILGCSSGNVAENVVIERDTESTVTFMEGARSSYLGYVTLKFSPDISSSVPHHKHYCLEIGENCSPVIDHCIIRSTSVGNSLFVDYFIFLYRPRSLRSPNNMASYRKKVSVSAAHTFTKFSYESLVLTR